MSPVRRQQSTDAAWERLAPLLPPPRPVTGRPADDHRTVLNDMLWILRTDAPWRGLPERGGNWQTVSARFRRWRTAGTLDRIPTALQREVAFDDQLDGSLAVIDGTNIRAHQTAGANKGERDRTSGAAGDGGASSTS